jgi:hypothetical protein
LGSALLTQAIRLAAHHHEAVFSLLEVGIGGASCFATHFQRLPQFLNALPPKVLFLSFSAKPGFVTISFRHWFLPFR